MIFKNYSQGILNVGMASGDTTMTLQSGYGAYWPDPAVYGSYPIVVFRQDYGDPTSAFLVSKAETMTVTAKSGDSFTVTRSTSPVNLNESGKTYRAVAGVPDTELNAMRATLFGCMYGYGIGLDGSTQYNTVTPVWTATTTDLMSGDGAMNASTNYTLSSCTISAGVLNASSSSGSATYNNLTPVKNRKYIATIDVLTATGGSFTIGIGGNTSSAISTTGTGKTFNFIATGNNLPVITFSNFSGTIDNWVITEAIGEFDLNGNEKIIATTDRDFETNVGNWISNGNHRISQSNDDKYAGTYSGKIVASAAGDSTTNYISLPYANFGNLTLGYKNYLELYVRGVGILGSNILTGDSSTFDATVGNWVSVTSTVDWVSGEMRLTGGQAQIKVSNYSIDGLTTIGKSYKITFTARSATLTLTPQVWNGSGYVNCDKSLTSSNQTFTCYLQKLASNANFGTLEVNPGSVGDIIYFDNITFQEITSPVMTVKIGNQSTTLSNMSCVPGTFTKFTWAFQVTSNEVSQDLKIYINQADTIYIDAVSFTQQYDAVFAVWVKPNTSLGSSSHRIINMVTGLTFDYALSTGNIEAGTGGGTNVVCSSNNPAITNNIWNLIILKFDKVNGSNVWVYNGTTNYENISINNAATLTGSYGINVTKFIQPASELTYIGSHAGSNYFLGGQLGEIKITRFVDVAACTDFSPAKAYYQGLLDSNTGGTPTKVFHCKFQSSNGTTAKMLTDLAQGATITGTNITIANQIWATETPYMSRRSLLL